MADNYFDTARSPTGTVVQHRAVEVAPGVYADAIIFVDASGNVLTGLPLAASTTVIGKVDIAPVSAAAITIQAASATSVTLKAANSARKGLKIYNTDANPLRIKYGATASSVSFTDIIPGNGSWVMDSPTYTGIIDALWDAVGAGSAYVTEY